MKLDWQKVAVYSLTFFLAWFILLNQLNPVLAFSINNFTIHIHHSVIGIAILLSSYIFDKVTKKRYEWLVEVLVAIGLSLLIHHIITEGFI